MTDDDASRLGAFGTPLLEVHDRLRDQLADLRDSVGAVSSANGVPATTAVQSLRDLRTHCTTFCSALDRHHRGEDAGAFPVLADRYPDLEPTLDKLRQDHAMVETLLDRLRDLTAGLRVDPDPGAVRRVRGEIDGLSAIVESHFAYEERTIIDALNTIDVPEWRQNPPAFLTG